MSGKEQVQKNVNQVKDLMEPVAHATLAVEGVSSMSETFTESIVNLSGIIAVPNRGVHIAESNGELVVDLYINVYFHTKIPSLAWEVQSAVKKVIEDISDFTVKSIDIHVQGVDKREKEDEKENE